MPEKILVVEDEPSLQETLAYNLEKQGYQVETVSDGRLALDSARARHPDLIVLDIMLPGLDGFEVCKILRKEMSVPILVDRPRRRIDRVVSGRWELAILTKPSSMRELLAR
jgi:DNA-binding response OmpR family regulator